jgi:DNA-binding transcriptional MerR regulator
MNDEEARARLFASDKLYYRIGEVSKLTGVKAHVLRYWETEFRWMAPPKSRSKQRLYRKRDIEFVWLLKRLLWDERYTIAGARQRIQELGVEGALALLHEGPTATAADGARSSATKDVVQRDIDWASLREMLDEMHSEVVSLRGVLQEGV